MQTAPPKPPTLETVKPALLLILLIHRHHPLLQPRHPGLRLPPCIPLLLHRLQRQPCTISLLSQRRQLILVHPGLLLPRIHVVLGFFALVFQIDEGFFEGGGELFFGKEVFFDGADAGFLILGEMGGYGRVHDGVIGGHWGGWEGGVGREGREGDCGGRGWEGDSGDAFAHVRGHGVRAFLGMLILSISAEIVLFNYQYGPTQCKNEGITLAASSLFRVSSSSSSNFALATPASRRAWSRPELSTESLLEAARW